MVLEWPNKLASEGCPTVFIIVQFLILPQKQSKSIIIDIIIK